MLTVDSHGLTGKWSGFGYAPQLSHLPLVVSHAPEGEGFTQDSLHLGHLRAEPVELCTIHPVLSRVTVSEPRQASGLQ